MKKLSLLFLCLFATVLLQAQTATAPSTGDGSSGNPYRIATLDNLYWIAASDAVVPSPNRAARWDAYYIQTANIYASGTSSWFSGAGWPMIGYLNDYPGDYLAFSGSYNGQGHTIDGLYINLPSTIFVGPFGFTWAATIKNLGLTNVSITGYDQVGGLIGSTQEYDIVDSCYVTGSVTANYVQNGCGGLIGFTNDATVSNCYSSCTVVGIDGSGSGEGTGGLIGMNYGNVYRCYSAGSVSGHNKTGGLIGASYSGSSNFIVENCYSTCLVSSSGNYVGGLIGIMGNGAVNNCYFAGSVSGISNVGGLIGTNGTDGSSGTNGTDGTSGTSGSSGTDGTSVPSVPFVPE
ncbi:MAG: hypothetical protein HGB12_12940, partial [Bacteroidetes bacterium]|nr:hypothetical protein [Bacteroidota bacterium]